jgi:hypothetical protein
MGQDFEIGGERWENFVDCSESASSFRALSKRRKGTQSQNHKPLFSRRTRQ